MDNIADWEDKVSFFLELGKPLSKARTVKETIDAVMYQVGLVFRPVHWSLLLKDSKSNDMVFTAVTGSSRDKLQGLKLPEGEGIAGYIYSTGKPVIVKDVTKDKRFSSRIDQYTGFKTQSIIGVPLKTGKSVFGVIELINKLSGDTFKAVELKILSAIAEYAAIAIERSYYYQSLKKIALVDPLTGLKNKASFNHTLANRMDIFDRYEIPSALILVNIVHFRKIVDAHGYQAGDSVLKQLAGILNKSVRKVDETFRYEADRFIVLMPHTSAREAQRVKERIMNHVEYSNSLEKALRFNVSADIHPVETKSSTELLDIIHTRVYKTSGAADHQYADRIENNIQSMLDEEKKALPPEEKKPVGKGKTVRLMGSFIHSSKEFHGDITVRKLSTAGILFETTRPWPIKTDDLLDVKFTLDDRNRSRIRRQVIVKHMDEKSCEGVFYNPPPYDKNLGFYLIN